MAYSSNSSVISLLFTLNILLAVAGQAVAGRDIKKSLKMVDTKKSENCVDSDGNLLIPGVGGMTVPLFHLPYNPPSDSSGETGTTGPSPDGYIPGGDDTFVPNPGVEVPNPAGGGLPTPP